MNLLRPREDRGASPFRRAPVPAAMAAGVVLFLWAVAQFYHPKTGFTSLVSIGDILDGTKVSALRALPHHVYEDSAGYDGAYYVQLALHPTLDNPELKKAIDNLPYRARRILFCWTAWLLGLGQPAWIVQAHALLNVICWLALAALLLRWFPPTDGQNLLRWSAVMFSHGMCMSVRHSLVDGPSLLLVALAMASLEQGRRATGGAILALAGLGKETSLLAVTGVADPTRGAWRQRIQLALTAAAIAAPLFAWMAYVRWKFGPAEDPGLGNFTWPLLGLAEKWAAAAAAIGAREDPWIEWTTLGSTAALTAQMIFFLTRWRPENAWWRVGVVFAVMMLFLSTPVWEGFPGAFTRVLLPMTLAFNLLVPRGSRWWALLLLGNLSVLSTIREFTPPAAEFFQVRGDAAIAAGVQITPTRGWYGPETGNGMRWRWSNTESELTIRNQTGASVALSLNGRIAAPDERHIRAQVGERVLWSADVALKSTPMQFGFEVSPGETQLRFVSVRPSRHVGTDPRSLAFNISNLDIVVRPAARER